MVCRLRGTDRQPRDCTAKPRCRGSDVASRWRGWHLGDRRVRQRASGRALRSVMARCGQHGKRYRNGEAGTGADSARAQTGGCSRRRIGGSMATRHVAVRTFSMRIRSHRHRHGVLMMRGIGHHLRHFIASCRGTQQRRHCRGKEQQDDKHGATGIANLPPPHSCLCCLPPPHRPDNTLTRSPLICPTIGSWGPSRPPLLANRNSAL
jgi:hypothetical protein